MTREEACGEAVRTPDSSIQNITTRTGRQSTIKNASSTKCLVMRCFVSTYLISSRSSFNLLSVFIGSGVFCAVGEQA
jgi:hypothetical protein